MTIQSPAQNSLSTLLKRLRDSKIRYNLQSNRQEATVTIAVAVPGQRWEIDLLEDGSIEVEVFRSDGTIDDETRLDDLFAQFSD